MNQLPDNQMHQVLEQARRHAPAGQQVWFVQVKEAPPGEPLDVTVYYRPSQQGPRLRKGHCLRLRASGEGPDVMPAARPALGKYAQVSDAQSPFTGQLDSPPQPLRPFLCPEGLTDDDIVALTDLARTELRSLDLGQPTGPGQYVSSQPVLAVMSRLPDEAEIVTGCAVGSMSGGGAIIQCVRRDGHWTVQAVGDWAS